MFGPVTNREQTGWQLRAARLLAGLLERAIREDLPPVAWSIASGGASLVAHCYGHRAADRRIQFERWQVAVGAVAAMETTGRGGVTHLSARARRIDGLVDVVVMADIFPDETED